MNAFYAAVQRASPKAVALGCLHQDDPNPGRLAEEALSAGLAGFKLHCQVQQVSPDDVRLFPMYEAVREHGAFVLFHAGTGPTEIVILYRIRIRFRHVCDEIGAGNYL